MSGSYAGIWTLISTGPISPEQVALARKLVGRMLDTGVPQQQWNLGDGSSIHVLMVNGTPKVTFTEPKTVSEEPIDLTNWWVPRGFVLRMASASAPGGVGLPVVLDGTSPNPEAAINLDPGTDFARWTAGGALAELLLSTDADAGYPKAALPIAPLLYKDGPGLRFFGNPKVYEKRPANADWKAYRPQLARWDGLTPGEVPAQKRELWEAINAHRDALGLPAMELWPRGYYRPGQLMANVEAANGDQGASSTGYPDTYRTPGDRMSKDGYPLAVEAGDTFERGAVAGSTELRHAGGSAADALEAWLSDADAKAAIELDTEHALMLDVGVKPGFWVATITAREDWIDAGCCQWTPGDGRLPPLSWRGFRSRNLGFETFPVAFGASPADPLATWRNFIDAQGECWLRYYRTATRSEPALGRHVYLRGRAIALAPHGQLVWAAGVMAVAGADRLIVLTHDANDQPVDVLTHGMTRYLRVWWCDVPNGGMSLRADRVICGTDADDPYGWRGGTLVDVGVAPQAPERPTAEPNALKYTSTWRFSPDGSRAICLRDYGARADYGDLLTGTSTLLATGLFPRALELVFTEDTDGLSVTPHWLDFVPAWTTAARSTSSLPGVTLPPGTSATEGAAWPIAVDYDPTGAVRYAFKAECYVLHVEGLQHLTYLGTGSGDTVYASAMQQLVLAGAEVASTSLDFRHNGQLQVLDVRDGVFVAEGTRARQKVDYATGHYTLNPDFDTCKVFTELPVHGVRAWRAGVLLEERWFPCHDGVVVQLFDLCDTTTLGTPTQYVIEPVRGMSRFAQGDYVQRQGEWLCSVQLSPQPALTAVRDSSTPDVGVHDCGCATSFDDYALRTHLLGTNELAPRGGLSASSFALPPTGGEWIIDAKVV